jgi:hypothetical protein
MMRTTIHVDDQLLIQAKAQAATLGVTVGQLIEDVLRASLMRRDSVEPRGRVRLITMQGTGTRPGITGIIGDRPRINSFIRKVADSFICRASS